MSSSESEYSQEDAASSSSSDEGYESEEVVLKKPKVVSKKQKVAKEEDDSPKIKANKSKTPKTTKTSKTSKTPTSPKSEEENEESKDKKKKEKKEDTRVYVITTGASKGDLLVGCSAANKGLVIKIICREAVQSDGTIKEEDDILPLPSAEKLQELASDEGTWEDDDKWDGKAEVKFSTDFSDANPYKIANGKHYTSEFQRAICLSREELETLEEAGVTPTGLALTLLSHTTYNKTEQFKEMSKQSSYKKQMKKVEETAWVKDKLLKDSLFDNIRFEIMNAGAGNRNWAFEACWANCKDQSIGITFDDVKNEILTQQQRTKSSAPPTYFLNYHNLEKMNGANADISKFYTPNYEVLKGVAPHPEHGEVSKKLPEAAFQLLYEKNTFSVKWITKKTSEGQWPPTLAWNVLLDVSGKKVLFSTNIAPDKKKQWQPASYEGPSYEELKSLLQKLTRLCYGHEAVRVANRLINLRRDYSFTKKCYRFGLREFLHRIMVINLEDGFVHPNYPILGWLLMVEFHCAPFWFPHKEHIELCLKTVFDVAQSDFRELLPPSTFKADLLELKDLEGLENWEASFIASIQMRVSQKGTQGDKLFMLREMNMWTRRFKNAQKSEFGSRKQILEKWEQWEDNLMIDDGLNKKELSSQDMRPTDWVVNALDFHIYGQILDRLIEESPDVYIKLLDYSKKKSVAVADLLQTMVWENRSAVYKKKTLKAMWPNTASEEGGDVVLSELFDKFGRTILDLIAAEYIYISNAKNFKNLQSNNNNNSKGNGNKSKAIGKGEAVHAAPLQGKKLASWCDGNIDWHFHVEKICEEFDCRTEVIKVPKKVVGVELEVKYYIYKTKTKKYMVTRVNTKGTSSSTPHALFSLDDIENEEESEEFIAVVDKIFAGFNTETNKNEWKKVLSHLITTFESNKKKEKQDSVFYRPSWFDEDLFMPIFELKVEKSNAGWVIQVVKTAKQLKFKTSEDVSDEQIKTFFGYKDKVPVLITNQGEDKKLKKEETNVNGKQKRKADDIEVEDIPVPTLDVLGYYGPTARLKMSPVFSSQDLKEIADTLHDAVPLAQPLFEVAKHLLLSVCFKMVLREGKKHVMVPASDDARRLFRHLVGAHIVDEDGNGFVVSAGILTSTVAVLVFHLVWDIPVSHVVCPKEEIKALFVKVCKLIPNPVALLPALYKVTRLIRDSVDNHQLTIGFAKRLRNSPEGPEPCDRDAKLILLILFHGADICCPKKLGLDLFEIRSCVPKKCLEQIHTLLLEFSSALSKTPSLEKRVVGKDIPLIITGQKFDTTEVSEWNEAKCIAVQQDLESKGKCGTSEYLAACERLAYVRFSRSQNRNVLGWQKEGVRWLLRAEAVLGGGLLADDMGLGKTLQSLLLFKSYHQPVGPTLILCKPVNIHRPWVQELLLQDNFDRSISFYIHHTDLAAEFVPANKTMVPLKKRKTSTEDIRKFQLVITSYTTFMTEWRSGSSPLQGICWERVILDEATVIKNSTTLTAKAVRSLNAQYRWALTGTPVENNVSDLGGLLHFLRIKPFCYDDWFSRYQDKRRFEMLHTIMLRRHKEGIIKQRKQVAVLRVVMSEAERSISTYIESVYNRTVQESKIDTSNTQGKDKNVLNNWLAKRIATTTNPAVWLFWPIEKTDVNGPVRKVAQNWLEDDEYLKDLPKQVFSFMKANLGESKINEVTVPQVLLESGKFVKVCKLIEDLVGAKRPSTRPHVEQKIKSVKKELKLDANNDLGVLFDRMFESKHEEFLNQQTTDSVVGFVKAGLVVAEPNSVRTWLDGLKEDEFLALTHSDTDTDFLENDQLLSERLCNKGKVAANISKLFKKWKPAWALTDKAWELFTSVCGECFGTEGKMRPIQQDEKIVVWVNNQKIARLLERLMAPKLLQLKVGYAISDASGGRGWIQQDMKESLQESKDSIWRKGCEYDEKSNIWKRKDKNGNTMAQEAFAADPKCKVFLTTYGSSSHGIGLTAGRNVILAESHYNPAQILQSEDRCYRIGQKRDVFVYHLQSYFDDTPTVEEVVFKVLEKKRKLIQETIEGGASEIDAGKEEGLVDAGYYVPRV